MYCIRKVTDDLTWVGSNDRRLSLFEGVYSIPEGVSYNSYVLLDEKTVLFDTVDKSVDEVFYENVAHVLNGRPLDYLVINHMEPDHAASIAGVVLRWPEVKLICNAKTAAMIRQFFSFDLDSRAVIVKEGDVISTGRHQLTFVLAPMVHWPEVMVTYDLTDKILFSADAFGHFGTLDGHLFADEVDFYGEYMDYARRYLTNIVGKYGPMIMATLAKASTLELNYICPLHGFVWRKDFGDFIGKYAKWGSYEPEETGVVIAYASIYGHTANAAEILACRLAEKGIRVKVFDASMTPPSYIISDAFRYSHLVFAAPTYNMGVFTPMDTLLREIAAHNLQNRTVAFIENGTWAPVSGRQMREIIAGIPNTTILDGPITIKSSVKDEQNEALSALADAIEATIKK
ncbi:MAG: FprA family A-type flavoprotein [Clostridiales bacterium]|nr:FprA family A-type flavoprotein [Clostridiales bacterium]